VLAWWGNTMSTVTFQSDGRPASASWAAGMA